MRFDIINIRRAKDILRLNSISTKNNGIGIIIISIIKIIPMIIAISPDFIEPPIFFLLMNKHMPKFLLQLHKAVEKSSVLFQLLYIMPVLTAYFLQ